MKADGIKTLTHKTGPVWRTKKKAWVPDRLADKVLAE